MACTKGDIKIHKFICLCVLLQTEGHFKQGPGMSLIHGNLTTWLGQSDNNLCSFATETKFQLDATQMLSEGLK